MVVTTGTITGGQIVIRERTVKVFGQKKWRQELHSNNNLRCSIATPARDLLEKECIFTVQVIVDTKSQEARNQDLKYNKRRSNRVEATHIRLEET